MNIVLFVDKDNSAIDRLAHSIVKHVPHLKTRIVPFHPKRPDDLQIQDAKEALEWADLIQVCYWKTGDKLREMFPEYWDKPSVVWHHNPYDIDKHNWIDMYNESVVHNESMHTALPYSHLIPHGINLDFYKYNDNYTDEMVVNMVVARIEGKKGVKEVAQACHELGYKFVLVGRVSSSDYIQQVMEAGQGNIEFRENITDDELLQTYHESALHVCNSVDNFESGTMPILESMACGVPVLTRRVGHVPDLYDGTNMVVRDGKEDDYSELRSILRDLMENKPRREKLREKAWQTVKNRTEGKMARMFSTLWYRTLAKEADKLVSIIIPTKDPHESFVDVLASALNQDYKDVEVIVVDSGVKSIRKVIETARLNTDVPIKYIRTDSTGYTLPKARNLAVIESEGEYLVFCDDRILMDNNAVRKLHEYSDVGVWVWGVKDGYQKGFVENFSMVRRQDLIRSGMFNERITQYGGATQDIRTRFEKYNGMNFQLAPNAHAKAIKKSSGKWNKREDIIKSKLDLYKLYG